MNRKKRVVILGGGYGGIKTLETLADNESIEVTLIDKNRYHYLQTESYNLVALKSSLDDIIIPLDTLVKGIDKNFCFIQDEVVKVDTHTVTCKEGEYFFDYLIIAVGVKTLLPSIFRNEHLFEVKNLSNALHLKHSFEDTIVKHLKKEKTHTNIVVVGGGSSGVEIAAEMQNYLLKLNLAQEIQISLIADAFLGELDEDSRKKALQTLQNSGIRILQKMVQKVEGNNLYLEDELIAFDFGVVAIGLEASEFIKNLGFEKEKNFLKVDEYLRVDEHIFAIGDCVFLKDKRGETLPQTAQTAEQSGVIAAKNILRTIQQKPLIKANIKIYGLAIALGGKFAIATASFVKVDGILGYLGKKAIEQFYKIPLKLKS
ncbi:hypothetical protein FJR45_05230 [Sulfurimonas sediminis]|uniref:FAD/NAD(P)-binding domain-containing protein n=1 Tax=Sulfurimonas sediminis TaxID=2590020 RepID=A0A7M1B168_9BACT|nr:FAD-dependent oxidoreductase [Sulfurimonas sediminis]QOP43385.1 hypothetical protein FJR45_05230 [Sulfurimonas sediminis]